MRLIKPNVLILGRSGDKHELSYIKYVITIKQAIPIIFISLFLNVSLSHGQVNRLSFDHFSIKEGLPTDGAQSIIQDRKGYIWMATLNGLVKYDGYQFRIYRAVPGDATGKMPVGRSFGSIIEAKDGKIWAGSYDSGFTCYDPITELFTNFSKVEEDSKYHFKRHEILTEDSQGRIWMFGVDIKNGKAQLRCYDPRTNIHSNYQIIIDINSKIEFSGIIAEDKNGYIWVGHPHKGIYKLNEKTKRFDLLLSVLSKKEPNLACDNVSHLRIDSSNQLWISSNRGIRIFNINTLQFHPSTFLPKSLAHIYSTSINYTYEDKNGAVWFFVDGEGLVVFRPGNQTFGHFSLQEKPLNKLGNNSSNVKLVPVVEDQMGIWFVADVKEYEVFPRHYFFYSHKSEVLTHFGTRFNQSGNKPNELPVTYLLDNAGLIWIGNASGGVNRQNLLIQQIEQWNFLKDNSAGIASDTLMNVKEDSENQIWIMGHGHISKFDSINEIFTSYSPSSEKRAKKKILFNTFQEDGLDNLWVGSNVGLYKYQKKGEKFSLVLPLTSNDGDGIVPLFMDNEGQLWVEYVRETYGSELGFSLGVFDLTSERLIKRFIPDPKDSTSLVGDLIMDVTQDSKNRIWVASFNGLCRYDPQVGHFIQYHHDRTDSTSISDDIISFVFEDANNRIWVGTVNGGLNLYIEEDDRFEYWKDINGFLTIATAINGNNGEIWVGTQLGEGLFNLDPDKEFLSFYNKEKGLASNKVKAIIKDDLGYLWIPSTTGLTRFHPDTETFTVYKEEDGFDSFGDMTPYAKPFKASNGDIWINSFTKVYRVQPEKLLKVDSTVPNVIIKGLLINDQTYSVPDGKLLKNHISETNIIQLPYHKRNITFEFLGFHYARPSDNQYSYKLEHFDKEWSDPSYDRKAKYTSIPPGNYTFRVKASNAVGVWNEKGASLQIVILQAWWKSTWAILCYGILLAIGIWYLIKWRTKKQQDKIEAQRIALNEERALSEQRRELSEQLKKVNQLKDQFLANTSHELKTPLNGIIGLSEGIYDRAKEGNDKKDLQLIISSGKRLHGLVNDILDYEKLKRTDFDLQLKALNLHSVVELVLQINQAAIRNKQLELINSVPLFLPAVQADEHRLQQILHNLIGNAIKFTKSGKVEVRAEQLGHQMKIHVSDTGIGISKEKQQAIFEEFQQGDGSTVRRFGGTGLGLTISRQLVELHGGEIGVESEEGKGADFWFTLSTSHEQGEIITHAKEQLGVLFSPNNHTNTQDLSVDIHDKDILNDNELSTAFVPEQDERLRILIVDDEPINQHVLKNHLNSEKFDLVFADDGPSALAVIDTEPMFDLVLLDVMMPGMSGYEVCKEVRKTYLPSELPVIMVTAKNQVNDLVQGLNRGANDYLAKPFSKQEFMARVRTHLDLHRIFDITGRFIPNEFIRSVRT